MKTEWKRFGQMIAVTVSLLMRREVSFHNCDMTSTKKDKRRPGFFNEEFRCTEMLCLCSKTYCCYDVTMHKFEITSIGLNKCVVEQNDVGPMDKYSLALDEKTNFTSTIRGFRLRKHAVAL